MEQRLPLHLAMIAIEKGAFMSTSTKVATFTYKPELVLENETNKTHWDFEIQTDHPIPARRPDIVLINKK